MVLRKQNKTFSPSILQNSDHRVPNSLSLDFTVHRVVVLQFSQWNMKFRV
jgi:hypothetical protein